MQRFPASESAATTGFHPIQNPYVVGNPVRNRSTFFGREAEFEYVRALCHGTSGGGLLVFCGERRSGKTSILFQITGGRLGAEFIPVLIDMQFLAIRNEVEFLERISSEVVTALGPDAHGIALPDFTGGPSPAARFLRLASAAIKSRSTATVESRSSHNAIGSSVSFARLRAKARVLTCDRQIERCHRDGRDDSFSVGQALLPALRRVGMLNAFE